MTSRFDAGVTSGLSVGGDASLTSATLPLQKTVVRETRGQVLMGDKGSVVQAPKSGARCVGDESKLAAHAVTKGAVRYQRAQI